ncbi:hypothetical protein BKA69DRAFT_1108808 [Paraphysoderma sedebokerense]|nr:hypothetical protein BKA69DRAFT_1108808 [Paraphysoderma sedebokerense]
MDNNKQDAVKDTVAVQPASESTPLLPSAVGNDNSSSTHSELFGLLLMSASALFFSSMSALVKFSGLTYPPFEVVLARSLIQFLLGAMGCLVVGVNPFADRDVRLLLIARGTAGAIGLGLYFWAIINMELADATVIFFTGPAFTTLFAYLALGEPITVLDIICTVLCLGGVILVGRPSFLFPHPSDSEPGSQSFESVHLSDLSNPSATPQNQRVLATFAAFFAAIMSAIAYVLVRKAGRHRAHYFHHVTYFGLMSTILSAIVLFTVESPRLPTSAFDIGILLSVGLTAYIGQIMLNKGLQLSPAGPGVLMRNLDVVFAFIFGVLLFKEVPRWTSIVGGAVIVGCAIVNGVNRLITLRRN